MKIYAPFEVRFTMGVMCLSEKQKRFCDHYIETGNATEAARLAGYSKKYANTNAAKLLHNTTVKEYIDKRLQEMASERIADATEVLETLTRVMRRTEKETIVVTCKTRINDYDENGKKRITEKEEPVLVEVPTKISDVNKAAELLGKRYGLYTDKINVEGALPVVISGGDALED